MKDNKVDIMHLHAVKSAFLDSDDKRNGRVPKKDFILKCSEMGLSFPFDFFIKVIVDLQEDRNDNSEDAILLYENLVSIQQIYSNMPIFLKGDSNNSANI